MRRLALLGLTIVPICLVACGDTTEEPPKGSSSSSSSSGSSSSVSSSGAGGDGGAGTGGASTGGSGTGGSSGNPIDPTYVVDMTLPTPQMPGGGVKFYTDIAYGTDPQQKLDLILPNSATPTPLMIHIHGGGFVGGDKMISNTPDLQQTVTGGVAYASLNYRLLVTGDKEGVIKPMTDCKRALQFLRYHAAELNIDPTKVVLKGGSAGAGTSLWIGLHDEMAGNGDAVDKMSTRVLGIAANATQATYDLGKWESVVFLEFGLKLLDTVKALGMEQQLAGFYGMDSAAQFDTPEILAYRAEVDMLALMSPDDPPVYVHNPLPSTAAPMNTNELYHHGAHAKALKAQSMKSGVSLTAVIEAYGVDESNGQNEWTFLTSKLK